MEKTFGVGVPNSEVAGRALQTVNSIHDYIIEKTERPAAEVDASLCVAGRCRQLGGQQKEIFGAAV